MNVAISNLVSFFGHRSCKEKTSKLIQASLDDNKKIQSLNNQVLGLINQIQELKAVHDYQTFKLEETIAELKDKLNACKSRRRAMRMRPRSANSTSNV